MTDLTEIAVSVGGDALSKIFKVFAEDYAAWSAGEFSVSFLGVFL
jgi:hypothetical protein